MKKNCGHLCLGIVGFGDTGPDAWLDPTDLQDWPQDVEAADAAKGSL